MAKWEPKVVDLKPHRIPDQIQKQLLEELAELFYAALASSEKSKRTVSIGSPAHKRSDQ